jgi:hypothetical protein
VGDGQKCLYIWKVRIAVQQCSGKQCKNFTSAVKRAQTIDLLRNFHFVCSCNVVKFYSTLNVSFSIDVIHQMYVTIVSMVVEHILTSGFPSAVNMYIIYVAAHLVPVVEVRFNKRGIQRESKKCQKLYVIWKEEMSIL